MKVQFFFRLFFCYSSLLNINLISSDMPTSSQSQILSVVDYQLLQQQQPDGQDGTTLPIVRSSTNPTSINESKRQHRKEDRRPSIEHRTHEGNRSPPPPSGPAQRRNSSKVNDSLQSTRASQRTDVLHIPIINLNNMAENEPRTTSSVVSANDNRQIRTANVYGSTRSTLVDTSIPSVPYRRNSLDSDDDEQIENTYKSKHIRKHPTPASTRGNASFTSDLDRTATTAADDDDNEDGDDDPNNERERRASLLNENARRLLILGTIRPSRTFYKNLPEADVNHLMAYFRRMKSTQQRMTSEEINQELAQQLVEYKPKIFFDSACVTKTQVAHIEKLIEQHADKIRTEKAEFVKLENPMRFVIKPVDTETPLVTIPREYNDCFITLVTRSDPLRKSDLVTELVRERFLEDVKTNSLDISYFPGGVNYDVPHDDIDENGQMNLETYQKLKKRLNNRKVWYFDAPPEKRPNAVLAVVSPDSPIHIDHQRLIDALYDRLKTSSTNETSNLDERILSIEFMPLSCILNSNDISNQFIVDCDSIETKRQLMDKPLKIVLNKQSTLVEILSYDENMQREYEKFIKSEKYRELLKNHDTAVKRTSLTKQ